MKRQLLVEVDCGEKACAPCFQWRDRFCSDDPIIFCCGVFGETLERSDPATLLRCASCLAAEQAAKGTVSTEVARAVLKGCK